jgi:hypothetical protein
MTKLLIAVLCLASFALAQSKRQPNLTAARYDGKERSENFRADSGHRDQRRKHSLHAFSG